MRSTTANSTYKKLAVQWLNEALCFVSTLEVADSLVLRNRQLLVAAKRCAPGTGRVSVDGTRQTTQRLTSQTVKQNQNNIRTTVISRGQNVVTSQLYCTATYHSGRLEKVKLNKANVFLTVDSDSSTKNNGRLETSRELSNG
ncbi:MAG: hypothetical protein IM618_17450 [Cytophagales bacterium]|nr:hypothetical protein [Cytophagales bacterium]MCA6376120.1 hypothetical protein [Cytophagales bacterium]MCA6386200.1 hypothetical protein [Cytophagales bacterium]